MFLFSLPLFVAYFSFLSPIFLLVPTSHVYIGGLVLILFPSAPSISLHVVVVWLKHIVHGSPPHYWGQIIIYRVFNVEVATLLEILHDHVLSYLPIVLIFLYGMIWKVAFVGKTLLCSSALVNQGFVLSVVSCSGDATFRLGCS